MKFAIVAGIKAEAAKGLKGHCIGCGADVIPKCGEKRISHWAHKMLEQCDHWWENETSWHRNWKNTFPLSWQEIPQRDVVTNEWHIADVQAPNGTVVEFQHSLIDTAEVTSREKFYKKMVWLIDSSRLKNDYLRFQQAAGANLLRTHNPRIFRFRSAEACFGVKWTSSTVPVVFDFKGTEILSDPTDKRHNLYCLLPKSPAKQHVLLIMSRQDFVGLTASGQWFQ